MITANLVVKNEEEYLERVLTQVEKIADEILIADTGSEDKTIEIIEKFKKAILFKRTGEIKDIRNELLEMSKGDLIMIVDGDEVWEDKELEILKSLPDKYKTINYFGFSFRHFMPYGEAKNHKSKSIRLFRKVNGVHWDRHFPKEILIDDMGSATTTNNPRKDIKFIQGVRFLHYGGVKKQWRKEQPKKFHNI